MSLARKTSLFGLFFLALIWGRTLFEARREFRLAEETLANGDVAEAVVHFDRSAHWYSPGNPFVTKSLDQLWAIGQKSESTDSNLALQAYDSMRGSIYAVRHFYWPNHARLPSLNSRIAWLRAKEQSKRSSQVTFEAALAFHEKALARNDLPDKGWSLAVVLGFLGWSIAVLGWIFKGFDREGRMSWRPSAPWIGAIILFFSLWVVGLLRA